MIFFELRFLFLEARLIGQMLTCLCVCFHFQAVAWTTAAQRISHDSFQEKKVDTKDCGINKCQLYLK